MLYTIIASYTSLLLLLSRLLCFFFFFFQAEDGIRDGHVTGVQTCALPISIRATARAAGASPASRRRRARCVRRASRARRRRGSRRRRRAPATIPRKPSSRAAVARACVRPPR